MMIYALLTFKWFFAKEMHINKPKIAMLTHQPLPITIIFFVLHTALASGEVYDDFTLYHFYTLLVFALPITAWEVSRKIKARENENKYETFSKIFGTTTATLIPIILYSITAVLSMLIAQKIELSYVYYIVIMISLAILYFYFFRFLLRPTPTNNVLQKIAMLFTSLLFVTLTVSLIIKFPISLLL
jgi:4-hydroxybenzoate polyprenyltransferase